MNLNRHAYLTGFWIAAAVLAGCKAAPQPQVEVAAIDSYVKGQNLADAGQLDEALAELARAIAVDPSLSMAHAAMGDIYRKQGSYDLAARAYDRACQANPYNFRNHYNLGVIRQMLAEAADSIEEATRQLALAVEVYLRAVTLRPTDFDANLNLGVCYIQIGKLDLAEQYCRKAVEIDPEHPYAYTNLGAVYDRQGKLYEAISAYRKSLEFDSRQPRVLVNLGSTYLKQGRVRPAIHAFELAVEMDPKFSTPQERLGYCYYAQGEYDKAAEYYQTAMGLEPRFADAHTGLGIVYMTQYLLDKNRVELRDKALAEWNRSLEINPQQVKLADLVRKYSPPIQSPQL